MKKLVVISKGKIFRYILRDFSQNEKPYVAYTNSYTQLLEKIRYTEVLVVFSPTALKQLIEDISNDR